MRSFVWLAAFAALIFAAPAEADNNFIAGSAPYERMNGDVQLESQTATFTTYDWGYNSRAVRICSENGGAMFYVRLGTVSVTSSGIFIDGQAGTLAGSAVPMFQDAAGTSKLCQVFPVRATAMTFHQVTVGTVSLKVQVFGHAK